MTPLQLEILLHYRRCGQEYRDGDFSAPAVREAMDWFSNDAGMLERTSPAEMLRTYKLTSKGEFFVDQLCAMPLPINVWVMPAKEDGGPAGSAGDMEKGNTNGN